MRFLVDNQLPLPLPRFLTQELDIQAIHVSDVGLREATDLEIWRFATAEDLILASKDDDFLTVFSKVPLPDCRRTYLLETFRRLWPAIHSHFTHGERLVEIR